MGKSGIKFTGSLLSGGFRRSSGRTFNAAELCLICCRDLNARMTIALKAYAESLLEGG